MRWRQFQEEARGQTWRLLFWFVLMLLALVLAVNGLFAGLYKLLMPLSHGWPALFFEANTGLVLLFVLGGCWVESSRLRDGGGQRVAHWMGGVLVQDHGDALLRRLIHVADEMAQASGQRPVAVYVLPKEASINAFVAGWSPEDACLCVTQGALEHLTRAQLQGLVAHEYGHLAEEDGRLCMRLLALVWGLSLLHGWGRQLSTMDERGHVSPLAWIVGMVLTITGWLGWLAGRALQAAVMRQREYLADARAIQYTRAKDGLGETLRKVWHQQQAGLARWHHPQAEALSFLWLSIPQSSAWLATHPPLDKRIERIYGAPRRPLPSHAGQEDGASILMSEYAPDAAQMPVESVALAGAGGAAWPTAGHARPAELIVPTPPEPGRPLAGTAQRIQAPEVAQALNALAYLSGPRQRRMAALALMMSPGNEAERVWWLQEAQGLHGASALLASLEALPGPWRLAQLEHQLRLLANESLEERRALVSAARNLLRADGRVSARDRLWWLLLRHRLGGASGTGEFMRPVTGQGRELSTLQGSELACVALLSAYLARLIPHDSPGPEINPEGQAWLHAVLARCTNPGDAVMLPTPPDADGLMHAMAGVRELSWALRPQLMRAWVEEALNHSEHGVLSMDSADALRLVANLIDTPMPPALASHYPAGQG
jgi:Zn-dependent protease with chaperone function